MMGIIVSLIAVFSGPTIRMAASCLETGQFARFQTQGRNPRADFDVP